MPFICVLFVHIEYINKFFILQDVNVKLNLRALHGGGSGLRLNDGFDVKLEIVG